MKKFDIEEKILWKRLKEKNLSFSKWSIIILTIFGIIIFYLLNSILSKNLFETEDIIMITIIGIIISLCFYEIYFELYDVKIKRNFLLIKESLSHYEEYDIITTMKLIQKNFNNFSYNVPERWKKHYYLLGKINLERYPNALLKKVNDIVILDLNKINVIINNKSINSIILLDEYIIKYEDGSIADFSKFITEIGDIYLEFISIEFSRNDPEQDKVMEILSNNFNFFKNYESSFGEIYVRNPDI
ncbi:MAG: hypothetical protein ACTSRP_20230 [Candidatus Helarchaeota archaeon]